MAPHISAVEKKRGCLPQSLVSKSDTSERPTHHFSERFWDSITTTWFSVLCSWEGGRSLAAGPREGRLDSKHRPLRGVRTSGHCCYFSGEYSVCVCARVLITGVEMIIGWSAFRDTAKTFERVRNWFSQSFLGGVILLKKRFRWPGRRHFKAPAVWINFGSMTEG